MSNEPQLICRPSKLYDEYDREDDLERQCSPGTPCRHPSYYLIDGNITFLVGKILFRVHRHFLMVHSPVFKDILGLPGEGEGHDDDHPIVLEQVQSRDFASVMWLFYNESIDTYTASSRRWTGILVLADKYQMDTIKRLAVEYLRKMTLDPVEKIVLHQKYDLDSAWALDAYMPLCRRSNPLTLEEGAKVGVKVLTLIAKAREEVMRFAWYRSVGHVRRYSLTGAWGSNTTGEERSNHNAPYTSFNSEIDIIRKIMEDMI